jgi:hypothetical protein
MRRRWSLDHSGRAAGLPEAVRSRGAPNPLRQDISIEELRENYEAIRDCIASEPPRNDNEPNLPIDSRVPNEQIG